MRKKLLVACVVGMMCLGLTGCKSSDYKEAVTFQEAGDYSSALTIYDSLGDYKDSVDRGSECQSYITAIDSYNSAKDAAKALNESLDTEVTKAEQLVTSEDLALDETLRPSLETAISETKAVKKVIPDPEMPATLEEINEVTKEITAIDYSDALANLDKLYQALDTSIQQYALVNHPSEGYIIDCLGQVANVVDISAVTEDNDPNEKLNKAGGYTAQVYFSSELVNQGDVSGSTVIEKGTDCGGSIEVYTTPEDAQKRNDYLAAFDGGIFASGSHTVIGTVLVRTSDKLKASEQKEMEANIITVLTTLK